MRTRLLLLLISVCIISSAFAWGKRGHNIVAEITFHYLSDTAKAKVMSYLQGTTIEDASTWLDEVRSLPEYKYTAPWHYVDFPKGTNYQPTVEPNAINALSHALDALQKSNALSDDSI